VLLHQAQALVSAAGSLQQLMSEATAADAAAAFQERVASAKHAHLATGGRRALQVTRDVLRDMATHVSSAPPLAISALEGAKVRPGLFMLLLCVPHGSNAHPSACFRRA